MGYEVIPINLHHREIEGLTTYTSVLEVAVPIDRATVYLTSPVGEEIVAEVAEKRIPEL